jgi:hypothetical protein
MPTWAEQLLKLNLVNIIQVMGINHSYKSLILEGFVTVPVMQKINSVYQKKVPL